MIQAGGQTALQRALGQYHQQQRDSKFETSTPTALSGIGKWKDEGQERIDNALEDQMTGNVKVQQYANLGGNFNPSASNPWEAFISTSSSEMQKRFDSTSSQGSHTKPAAKTYFGTY